jgi:hypothetical protein
VLAGLTLLSVPFAAAEEQSQAPVQPPQAQTQAPVPPQAVPGEATRFSFHRIGDAFVRLDGVTGQVAQCSQTPAGWTCTVAPDERTALDGEIARLQRENASLKKSLLARGDVPGAMAEIKPEAKPVPPGNVPDPSPGTAKPPADLKLPTDAEVDRAIAYMKGVWRKLVDMMMDLQRDIQQRKG